MSQLVRRRMRLSQVVLAVAGSLIYVALIAMLLWSHVGLDATTEGFGDAAQVNSIFSTSQRETLLLLDEIEQAGDQDGFDRAEIRLGLLQRQAHTLMIAAADSDNDLYREMADAVAANTAFVESAFEEAGDGPMDAALRDEVRTVLRDSEPNIKRLYDQSERELFDRVRATFDARRSAERELLGLAVLLLALAVILAVSLRRGVRSDFDRAYGALAREAAEREVIEAKLRASEHHFRALVHNASDVFTVIDRDDRISYQSPAVERGLGHRPDLLVGQPFVQIVDDRDHHLIGDALRDARQLDAGTINSEVRLRHANGDVGTFEVAVSRLRRPDGDGVEDGSQSLILNYRDISDRLRYQEQLSRQAYEDSLTGLANRARFTDSLERALGAQRATTVAVLYVDLDRFKTVNDSLGHDVGDELLQGVADRLRVSVSDDEGTPWAKGDTLARLGGDEFTILFADVDDPDLPERTAARIVAALRQPFDIAGHEVFITSSVGIAAGQPGDATPDELLRDADTAMYHAKWKGKNRYETFNPEIYHRAVERLQLETDLRTAVEHGEFTLAYQPIFDLATGEPFAVEALLRWHHPEHGAISPADFIPIAEETGLIVPIGRWVIAQACRQAAAWRASGLGNLGVNVNLSVLQFDDPDLLGHVRRTLETTGVPPSALCIEITESLLMENVDQAIEILGLLRSFGVRTAVDDFGDGHSSLRYLRDLPIDVVKVDRSFVADLDKSAASTAIFDAIISLGSTLGFTLTAEGIETEQQLRTLQRLGCPTGQGFLLARPSPFDEIPDRLLAEVIQTVPERPQHRVVPRLDDVEPSALVGGT